jgi:putative oxidoreductase
MSTFTTSPTTGTTTGVRRPRRARAARITRAAVRLVLAAQFAAAGVLKLVADAQMVAMFDDIGAGQGLRLLVGACEVAGAVGVLVPRLARLAAAGLVALMVGAAVTNVVALHTSPVLPLVLLLLAALVVLTPRATRSAR